jgi:hypothetical protein
MVPSRPGNRWLPGTSTGSRFLLAAPFSYSGGGSDHWYAWDIDLCWIAVVGAAAFASAEDALREWRDVVGPAASGAALSPCAAEMTARLQAPCLQTFLTMPLRRAAGHRAEAADLLLDTKDILRAAFTLMRHRGCAIEMMSVIRQGALGASLLHDALQV